MENNLEIKLPTQIRAYRIAQGLSQEELANQLHVSRQAISKWENGQSFPDVSTLSDMAALFNVSLDELVHGQSFKKGPTKKLPTTAPSEKQTTKYGFSHPPFLSKKSIERIENGQVSGRRILFHVILFLITVTIVATLIVKLIMSI